VALSGVRRNWRVKKMDRGENDATSCKQSDCTGIRKETLKETTKDLVRMSVALLNELQRYELH
jgi:hypothetical protein